MKFITLFFFLVFISSSVASTIGIATGNATIDGRPLLFKNKDRSDNYPSDVNFYPGAENEYSYVFQQNDGQDHTRARMGINSAGFGIVYSTSENLEGAGNGPYASQFSAIALKTCSTLQEFRDLLNSTNEGRRVHEHFGVIDSSGSGSLFEVDGYSYVEIPIVDSIGTMANTAKYHPSAGPPSTGSTSPDREGRAKYLLTHGPENGLDYTYFVSEIIKDFSQSQQDEDNMPLGQYYTNPVLSRYKTAIGGVIGGVKPGDNPQIEGAMWLCLSEPSLSIALPLFSNIDEIPVFIRSGSEGVGMAGSSDIVRKMVYDYSSGRYADRYADSHILMDIRKHTKWIQDSLFTQYEKQLPIWRTLNQKAASDSMTSWMFDQHYWAKSAYDSINIILSIVESKIETINTFYLYQNYPNPFNPSTNISFDLYKVSDVTISVFDVLGKEIWVRKIPKLRTGFHRILFETAKLKNVPSSGIYFYQLQTNQQILTKKMILLL